MTISNNNDTKNSNNLDCWYCGYVVDADLINLDHYRFENRVWHYSCFKYQYEDGSDSCDFGNCRHRTNDDE